MWGPRARTRQNDQESSSEGTPTAAGASATRPAGGLVPRARRANAPRKHGGPARAAQPYLLYPSSRLASHSAPRAAAAAKGASQSIGSSASSGTSLPG